MRHRLYYVLPDVAAARVAMDELLLARVEARHIRFMTGGPSLPPDDPSERDLAWFYKLYSLRGVKDGVEQMFFFAYLQKSDDSGW